MAISAGALKEQRCQPCSCISASSLIQMADSEELCITCKHWYTRRCGP